MKPIFTLLLLASGLLAKSTPTETTPSAVKAFEATYGKETPANWNCTSEGCQVNFEHKGQYITAVYTTAGHLRWYKKHLLSTQLPVSLQMGLKKHFATYWIADVQEQSTKGGTAYLLTMENGYKKVVLKSVGGSWQTVHTEMK